MKIFIIGAGAIGKALAACLKHNGRDVLLVRGSFDDGSTHDEEITLQLKENRKITAHLKVVTLSTLPQLDGLVLLTNKSFGNEGLSQKLIQRIGNSPLVLLQNGLGIERPFIEKGFAHVFRCVLLATAQYAKDGSISYKPVSISPIGSIVDRNGPMLAKVVEQMDTPDFRFAPEGNIQRTVWKKTIANCVFNSICPLLDVDNGIFYRNAEVFELASRIIHECTLIAQHKGIDLVPGEIENQVLAISKMSEGQFISTLQDIRNKKETEIDTLNLEIHSIAKELGLEHQVQQTRVLGELIRLKSTLNH